MFGNPFHRGLVGMIIVTIILGILAWDRSWIAEGDWIGWVQAVGSVEAIIASILIAHA